MTHRQWGREVACRALEEFSNEDFLWFLDLLREGRCWGCGRFEGPKIHERCRCQDDE